MLTSIREGQSSVGGAETVWPLMLEIVTRWSHTEKLPPPAPDSHALTAHCLIYDWYNILSGKDHLFSEDYLLNLFIPPITNSSWKWRGLVTAGSLGEVKAY